MLMVWGVHVWTITHVNYPMLRGLSGLHDVWLLTSSKQSRLCGIRQTRGRCCSVLISRLCSKVVVELIVNLIKEWFIMNWLLLKLQLNPDVYLFIYMVTCIYRTGPTGDFPVSAPASRPWGEKPRPLSKSLFIDKVKEKRFSHWGASSM